MIQQPFPDSRLSWDKTLIPEEWVSPAEIEALCEQMYQHACALCREDAQRRDQERVAARQLVQWGILAEDQGGYHPTYAWKLLTGVLDPPLQDACIQLSLYKGKDDSILIQRKKAQGPIYQQIEDAMDFVAWSINCGSRVQGAYRVDYYELPLDSVQELLSNAVCHRSYEVPGPIQLSVYGDRLDISSPGGLCPDRTIEQLTAGGSRPRNFAIAGAFQYMHIIQGTGGGLLRADAEIRRYGLGELAYRVSDTAFTVSIRRRPFTMDLHGVVPPWEVAAYEAK